MLSPLIYGRSAQTAAFSISDRILISLIAFRTSIRKSNFSFSDNFLTLDMMDIKNAWSSSMVDFDCIFVSGVAPGVDTTSISSSEESEFPFKVTMSTLVGRSLVLENGDLRFRLRTKACAEEEFGAGCPKLLEKPRMFFNKNASSSKNLYLTFSRGRFFLAKRFAHLTKWSLTCCHLPCRKLAKKKRERTPITYRQYTQYRVDHYSFLYTIMLENCEIKKYI